MTASDWKKVLKQLNNKPEKKAKFLKHNKPKERKTGIARKKWASKNTHKMSQDIIADALNAIRNAKKARKETLRINKVSKMLIEIFKIMKAKGAIKKYKIDAEDKFVEVTLGDFFECMVVKPRFSVKKDGLDKYIRRYLPARNMGTVIISTNKGLMTHEE